jgi:hypothetical protein
VDALKDTAIFILLGCAALSLAFGIKEHRITIKLSMAYGELSIFIIVVSAVSNFSRKQTNYPKSATISQLIDVVKVGGPSTDFGNSNSNDIDLLMPSTSHKSQHASTGILLLTLNDFSIAETSSNDKKYSNKISFHHRHHAITIAIHL